MAKKVTRWEDRRGFLYETEAEAVESDKRARVVPDLEKFLSKHTTADDIVRWFSERYELVAKVEPPVA